MVGTGSRDPAHCQAAFRKRRPRPAGAPTCAGLWPGRGVAGAAQSFKPKLMALGAEADPGLPESGNFARL